ncbi:fimbrial protein [Halobacteriovorax sp. GB3]|uniref:fimbrial protein n=1 Tax=Halobacteriovorax sp. GB3 TaxID=2719615 RepID=UPI0023612D27|nr:fimbrial protein [Halobacteriovorax sp. GB3]MDD0851844.1 fimbrial protein [Halobacteriovorax sp. GB3]
MKKSALALLIALTASTSFAATQGTLTLRGVVQELLSIDVQAESVATQLDLTQSQTDLKVATVNEVSNSKTGYKVRVESQNSGKLNHEDGSGVGSVTYTMKYGTNTVDLSSGSDFSTTTAGNYDEDKDVTISYTGQAQTALVAGEYSDTVYFTISAN